MNKTLRIGIHDSQEHLNGLLTVDKPSFIIEFMRCVSLMLNREAVFIALNSNGSYDSVMSDLPANRYDISDPRTTPAIYRLEAVDAITPRIVENRLAFLFGVKSLVPVDRFYWYAIFGWDVWACIVIASFYLHVKKSNRVSSYHLATVTIAAWLGFLAYILQLHILSELFEKKDLPCNTAAECAKLVRFDNYKPVMWNGTSVIQKMTDIIGSNTSFVYATRRNEIIRTIIQDHKAFHVDGETFVTEMAHHHPSLIRSRVLYTSGISYTTCLVRKGDPLGRAASKVVNTLRERGVTQQLLKRYFHEYGVPNILTNNGMHRIDLRNIWNLMITLLASAVGLPLAFETFVFLMNGMSNRKSAFVKSSTCRVKIQ